MSFNVNWTSRVSSKYLYQKNTVNNNLLPARLGIALKGLKSKNVVLVKRRVCDV